ncbi:MAG: hypothetical protein R3212_07830, partial [Xanthomonadales bacterium]|nr:hypothetical protein [Xanthomonadales bacterium]
MISRIRLTGLFLVFITTFVAASTSVTLHADQTLLLRQPALSQEHLAFVYAGDLWVSGTDGSHPRRLTSHPADERNPVFSPDGRSIAFAAEYEGNLDVYVIAVEGGQPRRLTWHPEADLPLDWSADGREVAMLSYRESDHGRSGQLYHVSVDGGLPRKQMEARIYRGSYSDDGSFAYTPDPDFSGIVSRSQILKFWTPNINVGCPKFEYLTSR